MTTTQTPQHTASRGRRTWHFVRHYLEMVVAMVVGMVALGPVEELVWPGLDDRLDVSVVVMATNMAIGMGAWMRFRGHSWRAVAEMSAAMYLPFAVLLAPYWAGAVSGGVLMTVGHVAMLPLMALAMLLRPAEYCH
ncbi:hypothetical protein ACI789_05225 [Geodermatophilus sp. SYSU D00965]